MPDTIHEIHAESRKLRMTRHQLVLEPKVIFLTETARARGLPAYATEGSAALDLHADISEELILYPGESRMVSTGLKVWIEDRNFVGLVFPRSGLSIKEGVVLGNNVGVIDSDYQGEWKLGLLNRKSRSYDTPVTIKPGDRVAQVVFMPIGFAKLVEVQSFDADSERGEGGFGSTGR